MFDNQPIYRDLSAAGVEAAKTALVNGISYTYRIWPGNPRLPAVLATHGLGDATDSFTTLGNDPRFQNTLIAFSLRGNCGTSPLPSGQGYSLAVFAADVANCVQHFGLKHPLLLAPSFGGPPIILYASMNPGVPSGIILVDSLPNVKAFATEAARRRLSTSWPDLTSAIAELRSALGISPEDAVRLASTRFRREFSQWRYDLDPAILEQLTPSFFSDVADEARALACPVHCVRSSKQSIIPSAAWNDLQNVIPGATGEIIPDSRHTIMLTAPDAFNRSVIEFAERLSRTYSEGDQ